MATCAGCGCACDDVEVAASEDALEVVGGTCRVAGAWFAQHAVPVARAAVLDGHEASADDAIAAAAAILAEARLPLVCGLGTTDVESQRAAVALADAIGAVCDPIGPAGDGEAGAAAQAAGLSTTTFGDVRDRADVVVAWRADPVTTHPCLLPRLRLERDDRGGGALHPRRTLHVVDAGRTATADLADSFVQLATGRDFEALWAMRALVRDVALDLDREPDLPLDELGYLVRRLRGASYGVVLLGAGLTGADAIALHALVRDLSTVAHVVVLPLRHDGNARGAEDVLAWQSGYPSAVSFARGHPRTQRGELSAAGLLERGEPDAALVVGESALEHLSPLAREHLARIPAIVVGPRATEADGARVALATATAGVHREGTIHRMDGVPLPLRAPLASPLPGDADVLDAIAARIREA